MPPKRSSGSGFSLPTLPMRRSAKYSAQRASTSSGCARTSPAADLTPVRPRPVYVESTRTAW
eukprot:6701035-Lingulodinium_polyedra.AAC.1